MTRIIIVLAFLIIEMSSGSGLFDGAGHLIPKAPLKVVLSEDIWQNFREQLAPGDLDLEKQHPGLAGSKDVLIPGIELNGDKIETELHGESPSLSGVEFTPEQLQNPTIAKNEKKPADELCGKRRRPRPNEDFRPHESIISRGNSSQPNVGSGVPDKNFIDWLPNPFTTTTVKPIPVDPKDCPKCQCGLSAPPNRIVGGVEAGMAKYPWVAYLTYNNKFYCAGSIISDRYLLTAAHCVDRFNKNLMRAVVGAHNRNKTSLTKTIIYRVADIIKHASYSTVNYNNDIALIKIDGRITFEGPMRPACLADRGPTYAGRQGIVTGWGATVESGSTSDTLQEVTVPIMTNGACRATKYPARKITENMICAGYSEGGKDSCQGDSGGPLHVLDGKAYKIVGIVSWGEGCAAPGYPGVYARVNRYITWIELRTKDSCRCSNDN